MATTSSSRTAHAATQQQQQRLHRTANNVIALGRVAKSSYCDHSGWASKQGSIIKSWKRRYFVLKGRELIYFAERSPSGKGIDEKGRLKVVGVEFTPEFRNGLLVKGELKNQTMKLQLETNDESLEWYAKIKDMLQHGGSSSSTQGTGAGAGSARVTMQGWLYKEGQNFKTWKKRYMTLSDRVIKYHARAGEAPLGEAVVNDYNVNPAKPFALDVFSDNNRIFRIAADSFSDIEAWDQAIAKAIGKAPCFGDPYADTKTPFLGDTFAETTTCEGWLYKRGQRSTAWKRRFFMLSGFQLQYQESPGESPKGEGSVVDLQLGEDGSNLMEIQLDSGRVLTVSADTKEQLDIWIHALCELLDKDPATLDVIAPTTRASASGASSSASGSSNALRRGLSLGSRQSSSSNTVTASSSSGDDESSSSARKTGWLKKQGKHMKSWKRRFFIVDDRSVTYCEQLHEAPKGSGVIQDVSVNPTFPNCLDIVLTTGRVLRVSAESPDEIRSWLQHIVDVLETSRESDDKTNGDAGGRASSSSLGALSRQASFDIAGSGAAALEPGKGWLMKKGKNFKTWKRRYFVLDGQKLSYASNVGESPLGCGLVSYVTLGNARPFCIDVRFKNGRILNVAASSEAEMIVWCKALQAALKAQHARASMDSDDDAGATEFDFDDNDDDESAPSSDQRVRHSTSGIPTGRPSLSQQASSRKSLGQQPSRKSMLGRGSSLDSDESFDDSVPYMDLSRASLDESLPGCSGWLRKEGSTIRNWKLRYFTLNGTLLSYFKSDNGPLIKTLKVVHVLVMRTKKFCLEVTAECGRKLLIAADSSAEYDRWLAALHQAVSAGKAKKETSTRKIVRL